MGGIAGFLLGGGLPAPPPPLPNLHFRSMIYREDVSNHRGGLKGLKHKQKVVVHFSADAAVDLWWSDCSSWRRVDQKTRAEYV